MARERGASSVFTKFLELAGGVDARGVPSTLALRRLVPRRLPVSQKAGWGVVEFQRWNSTPGRISGGPSSEPLSWFPSCLALPPRAWPVR
jgi:hypothetical protein